MSLLTVSFSGLFTVSIGKELIAGCYIRYTDETETKLWTEPSSATRAGRVSVISLWRDQQTGKSSSFSIQGIHLVPFLSVDDLFEVLEKRYLDSGKERGHDFDIDDYEDDEYGKTPTVLRGVKMFKYAQVMKGDDGISFDNKTRMMRARDVYACLLRDCSVHKHMYAAVVLAAISSKMSPKKIGEIIKKQHEEIVKDFGDGKSRRSIRCGNVEQSLAGCVFSNRYCPYYEENARLREDLNTEREENQIMRKQSAESVRIAGDFSTRIESLVKGKFDAEREARYYKTKWEESQDVIRAMSEEAKDLENKLKLRTDRLTLVQEALDKINNS